ncbi:MAG: diaminopimelate epimerase [Planctomycetes bacterium]|jgi:diaminopimelate epimerase|nr:diaminopimelate epimerase [Planctomycetota bacterium]
MERRILFCITCNAKYDVTAVAPGSRFLCKACRTTIRIPEYFGEAGKTSRELRPEEKEAEPEVVSADLVDAFAEAQDEIHGLSFTKMVGTGNDFVVVDACQEPLEDPARIARVLCDRRFGIGSDGLLLALPPEEGGDIRMRFFNPDGSEAEMCGNGLRCLAKYVHLHGQVKSRVMAVETKAGLRLAEILLDGDRVARVRIGLGQPVFEPSAVPVVADGDRAVDVPVESEGRSRRGTAVSLGNPHFVVLDPDVDALDLAAEGPWIETHPRFPRRTNVEFVQVVSRSIVKQRTWERGAGETLACGTGAGAVCAACHLLGKTDPRLTVRLRGGDLQVERSDSGEIFLEGPAEELFTGLWCPA